MPILVKLLAHPPATTQPLIPLLVERGRLLGLIRPSSRLQVQVPDIPLEHLLRRADRAQRAMPNANAALAPPHLLALLTQLLI